MTPNLRPVGPQTSAFELGLGRYLLLILSVLGLTWGGALWADRPNIVLYVADDLGFGSVGAYGADPNLVKTPNIDRLAEQGVTFTRAYTSGSVCSPTRYGMLTGRYSWRTAMKFGVVNPNTQLIVEPGRETLASWLQERGYQTAHFGKWHLGYGEKKSANLLEAMHLGPNSVGFDYHFGVPNNMDDHHKVYVENDSIHGLRSPRISPYGRSYYGRAYIGYNAPQRNEPEVMPETTRRAAEWIASAEVDRPFFLYYAAVAVHHPVMPSNETRGTSNAGAYGDFIHELDHSVGQLMAALEERGIAENTIVIFTSDNGGDTPLTKPESPEMQAVQSGLRLNGEFRGDKHTIYDGGFRVPFIVRWPELEVASTVADSLISTVDIFPTVAAALEEPFESAEFDGRSFEPVLANPATIQKRESLVLRDAKGRRALIAGEFKYISAQLPPEAKGPKYEEELYDLANDPGESTDLIKKMPEIARTLRVQLDRISNGD
jgi:arylsulfatase A-like enzyme